MVKKSIVPLGRTRQSVIQYFRSYAAAFEYDIVAVASLLRRKVLNPADYNGTLVNSASIKVVWSITVNNTDQVKATIKELDGFKEERRLANRAAAIELLLLHSGVTFTNGSMVFTPTFSTALLTQMNKFRIQKQFCDFIIKLDDKKFHTHKAILAASSQYLLSEVQEKQDCLIIAGIPPVTFEIILNFIYNDVVGINEKNVNVLKSVSSSYGLHKLVQMCELFEELQQNTTYIPEIKYDSSLDFIEKKAAKKLETDSKPKQNAKSICPAVTLRKSDRQAKREANNTISQTLQGMGEVLEEKSNHFNFVPDCPQEQTIHIITDGDNHENTGLTCPFGGSKFMQRKKLEHHSSTDKCESLKRDQSVAVNTSEKAVDYTEYVLKCEICDLEFSDEKKRKLHMRKHATKNQPNRFGCNLCFKAFRSASHLKRHMISHTGIRKHCCTTCGKLFLKADHLKRHERIHSSERPFTCEQCGKQFRDKDHLKRHNLTHTEERPYFCEVCGKQFKDKSTLLGHQKSHNSSDSVVCGVCGRMFKTVTRMEAHMLKHLESKAHICEICGKEFPFSGRLRKHMLSHTGARPFHCEVCGKQFRDGHSLRQHQKKHTGIGLHPCLECGKKFTNAFHLKRHSKIHSGDKPHCCDVCRKSFARPDNLEAHRKNCLVNALLKHKKCSPTAPLDAWKSKQEPESSATSSKSKVFDVTETSRMTKVQNNVSLPSALERGIDANRSPSDTEPTTQHPNDTMDSIQSQTFNALLHGGLHSAAAFRRLLAPPTSNSEIKAIMDCPTSKP